ncbi:MAG: type III-B CRISPR-associated protein Cas10/Cmr2 [Calothrix sp. C42_A2020_038]|nr:type III-B CRISPR-associated protein Cas10/Cmr2 [Calothrix sp. C42_A2020_038]
MAEKFHPIQIAIAWCVAWGEERTPRDLNSLLQMRQALSGGNLNVPDDFQTLVEEVKLLEADVPFPQTANDLKVFADQHPILRDTKVGLVYGGATKIKQYVFEETKLPDIRGASALLDRINLVDLPAFFNHECEQVNEWLSTDSKFADFSDALIPELIIYSTGGNILAFCPAPFVDDLANAIEKRYTSETLTANSCAVGSTFRLLELRFGLLAEKIEESFWLDKYLQNTDNEIIKAYFQQPNNDDSVKAFIDRKSFNELTGKLAALFNQRRNGNQLPSSDRKLRCYPPMFETHPYIQRDGGERRSAVVQVKKIDDQDSRLPGKPRFSEVSARKRIVGQIAKRDASHNWYKQLGFTWEPGNALESWVKKFERFKDKHYEYPHRYYSKVQGVNLRPSDVEEARSVREIADASHPKGFVAYIYADGNNMGGYIQKEIKKPIDYQCFSKDVFDATEQSVYLAIIQHLKPHKLSADLDTDRKNKHVWIHPFEIITIGGDDVMLIVPADKALQITQTLCEEFEKHLMGKGKNSYIVNKTYNPQDVHRYKRDLPDGRNQCTLSMSAGVLITAEDTPIYYAEKLTNQLLKSAKKKAKELKGQDEDITKRKNYYGGTIDFLVMKSVTMISSNISEFRTKGLTISPKETQQLKLYGAPYTLHELKGLLQTVQALVDTDFPRSQIYQIRSLLERGKQTAILNYRYFLVRLSDKNAQKLLQDEFEEAWCKPKDSNNNGNLAPWMSLKGDEQEKVIYETIWRELVDLYAFTKKTARVQAVKS